MKKLLKKLFDFLMMQLAPIVANWEHKENND